ncbi:hypothetical protein JTB14_031847, partial [Gonioctena quinquepunctata]
QLVVERWNNIRDQWLKWKNRDKNSIKSGAAASKLRKYLYHEQLNFLEQGLYHRSTDSSMAYEHTDEAKTQQQTEKLQSAADQGTATPDATKQTSQTPSAKIPTVKTTSVQQSTRKRRRTFDEFELRMLKSIEAGDQEDRHMQFFKGIIPSVQKFTDNQIVDFQMEVLQVIKKHPEHCLYSNNPTSTAADLCSSILSTKHTTVPLQLSIEELSAISLF